MSLADELKAVIDECVAAGNHAADTIRVEKTDEPAMKSHWVVLNANLNGIEKALQLLATKVEEAGLAGAGDK